MNTEPVPTSRRGQPYPTASHPAHPPTTSATAAAHAATRRLRACSSAGASHNPASGAPSTSRNRISRLPHGCHFTVPAYSSTASQNAPA
ncbi:MAG: hypothetical protein E6G35_14555 [Actinobacteria bacterium]|nr:MAG: hypothetical protein E6G35_14555 [Actinomycetota bacterium]